MKLKRVVAGVLAAAAMFSAPGVMQTAYAANTPSTVQSSAATTKAYQVKVTADQLNIRKSASNTAKIVGLLKKNNTVTISAEKKDARGVTWGQTSKGWINLSYTKKVSSVSYTGKVNVPSLNVRKSADNTSKVVKVLKQGTKVTITEEKTDSRGIVWGKAKEAGGWINTDFIKASKSVSYKIQVTSTKASVRQYASISAKATATVKKGAIATVTAEQKDSRGITWVKLANGKGWISMENAKKAASSTFKAYKVTITTASLKIHSSADLNAKVTGYLQKNAKVTITAEKKTSDGRTWGKLSDGRGWISLKFAKKV